MSSEEKKPIYTGPKFGNYIIILAFVLYPHCLLICDFICLCRGDFGVWVVCPSVKHVRAGLTKVIICSGI